MKRVGYIVLAILIIAITINQFVRVTPNDEGIIWFWLSQKLNMRKSPSVNSVKQTPSQWTEKEKLEILGHMTYSIENSSAAEEILRTKIEKGQKPTEEDFQRMAEDITKAISEAALVSDQALFKVHPELPKIFREKYQAYLSAISGWLVTGDEEALKRGAGLLQEFKDWGAKHQTEFSYPPK